MNHLDVVLKAGWYLRKRIRCYPVLLEACYGNSREQPDAIGWRNEGSYLIECKANRTDFLKDKAKIHRRGGYGCGNYRYYMAPHGIIWPEEVPECWGLLVIRGKAQRVYEVVKPKHVRITETGLEDELRLCRGALNNVQLRDRGMQIPESRHQIENLGRGYAQVYRDIGEKVRKHIIADISNGQYNLSREELALVRRVVERSAARYIPHEGYLRIMN